MYLKIYTVCNMNTIYMRMYVHLLLIILHYKDYGNKELEIGPFSAAYIGLNCFKLHIKCRYY